MAPIDAYRSARTPTEYYAARIRVLQEALPHEIAALGDTPAHGRRRLPPAERRWLEWLCAEVLGSSPPVRIRQRTLARGVRSLLGPDGGGDAGLVVLFSGGAGRLNIALATFLQHLPWEGREVLILADPSRQAYLAGIPGVAESLPSLAAWIVAHAAGRPLSTLGTSMGGGPAVIAGILAGADRAAAVGGSDPLRRREVEDHIRDPGSRPAAIAAELAAHRSVKGGATTDVLCVHSEGNGRDSAHAGELLTRVETGRRVVLTPARSHNVLREALDAGVLQELLALLIGSGPRPIDEGSGPIVLAVGSPTDPTEAGSSSRPRPSARVERRPVPPRRRRDRIIARMVRLLPRKGPWRRAVIATAYRLDVVVGVGGPGQDRVRRRRAP